MVNSGVRYNSGRPMVVAQRISAYMHNTAKYVKELSGHAFFNDVPTILLMQIKMEQLIKWYPKLLWD